MGFRELMLIAGTLLVASAGAEPPKETPRAKALAQLDGRWTLVAESRNGLATLSSDQAFRIGLDEMTFGRGFGPASRGNCPILRAFKNQTHVNRRWYASDSIQGRTFMPGQ